MNHAQLLGLTLLASSAVLAGCGGSSTPGAASSTSGTPTSASAPSDRPSSGAPASGPGSGPGSGPATKASEPAATEVNPPGDIPDDQVFVRYRPPGAGFTVRVPEGWARSSAGGAVTFTDKLNSITIESAPASRSPSVASVRGSELATVQQGGNYRAGAVTVVRRRAGPVVRATYLRDSAPDPVTDKVVRDAVERYSYWQRGTEAVLTLAGPKGADNVDPWRIVSDSLTWHR